VRVDEVALISLAVSVRHFSRRGGGGWQGLRLWNFLNGCEDFIVSSRVVFDILGNVAVP
jgi:hypothetical protein